MELRQLQYFITVCEELHFTKAADRLGISQPTLSQQIKVLEDELSTPLFDRIGKKIRITEAGKLLQQYSTQMLRDLQNAKMSIAELQINQRGTLRIAVLPSDLDYRMGAIWIAFHQLFPNVRLEIVPTIEIHDMVIEDKVDIGIGLSGVLDRRMVQVPLSTETYSLFVPSGHALTQRAEIELEELLQLPLILYPVGFVGRKLIDDCFQSKGWKVQTLMDNGSAASQLQLVKAGIGFSIHPHALLEDLPDDQLIAIPIVNDAPVRSIELLHRTDRYMSVAAQMFIELIQKHFAHNTKSL
ncbi:LysR family transcriptional regulator [Paenibacillus sp. CFBP13512]|uniref:LysR family transcriptional regulator n=1 Tax=Paenibacillus sp. CFBP13512 TaxID=2184007 RepID=UPI0010C1270C|nr:LysR substrate-binding domain-containing protein [Paenibacillus sp. CFBP13512]TKJ93542.1 LysR family transcriptional regulator [Paenibacillus sp. CFBP13512]